MNLEEMNTNYRIVKNLKKKVEKSLEDAPEGSLRCEIAQGKYPQYYWKLEGQSGQPSQVCYLKKEEMGLVEKLAQKEYDQKFLKNLMQQEKAIEHFMKHYPKEKLTEVCEQLSDGKRRFVKPYVLSDEEYLEKWYATHPGSQNGYPISKPHETERGEIVRSKTEQMIADKLYHRHIPYVYEGSLQLKNGVIYPDFMVLNLRKRKTYYLEHLGKMGDEGYCKDALERLDSYEANGIHQGDNLLLTMECMNKTFNFKVLDHMIDRYFI